MFNNNKIINKYTLVLRLPLDLLNILDENMFPKMWSLCCRDIIKRKINIKTFKITILYCNADHMEKHTKAKILWADES